MPSDEHEYLKLVKEVLETGLDKHDRTETGTRMKFGHLMRFSLRDFTMPLLTTKRVFWRGVVEELLWFIKGSTDANLLRDRNVHIWDANGSREFLDKSGFEGREEGDLGPVYGFQWRHFGAKYVDKHTNYDGQGIDQLANLIQEIKTNPLSRRLMITAWNPIDIPKMALPPCHCMAQFDVTNGELSCLLTQRSADLGLGVPFNIASYALLTHMIAHVTNLKAGELVCCLGNAHIYNDHIEPLKEQITREPGVFPKIRFNDTVNNIDDFKFEDIELIGYEPQGSISMKMSV